MFIDSYIPDLDADRAFIYPGSAQMVQLLHLFTEAGNPEDRERIAALRKLDQRARPTDVRGQATIPMREAAIARYEGDTAAFHKHSAAAWKKLKDHLLERHLTVAEHHDYIDKPDKGR